MSAGKIRNFPRGITFRLTYVSGKRCRLNHFADQTAGKKSQSKKHASIRHPLNKGRRLLQAKDIPQNEARRPLRNRNWASVVIGKAPWTLTMTLGATHIASHQRSQISSPINPLTLTRRTKALTVLHKLTYRSLRKSLCTNDFLSLNVLNDLEHLKV